LMKKIINFKTNRTTYMKDNPLKNEKNNPSSKKVCKKKKNLNNKLFRTKNHTPIICHL